MGVYAQWWYYCPRCDQDTLLEGVDTEDAARDAYLEHLRDEHGMTWQDAEDDARR